jgi:hypothetical protein
MDPNSILIGGLVYVGIPIAVGSVEGIEAGKTTAAVIAGAGLGGYIGASIGAMATGESALGATVAGIEIGGLVGAVLGGMFGYKVWESYKHTSVPMRNPRKRLHRRTR